MKGKIYEADSWKVIKVLKPGPTAFESRFQAKSRHLDTTIENYHQEIQLLLNREKPDYLSYFPWIKKVQ